MSWTDPNQNTWDPNANTFSNPYGNLSAANLTTNPATGGMSTNPEVQTTQAQTPITFPKGAPAGSSSEGSSSANSSNYAGFPQGVQDSASNWLMEFMKGVNNPNNPGYRGFGYLDNIYQNFYGNNGQNAYANIEKQRQSLIDQYMKSMQDVQQQYQPVMNNMSNRGLLNSSVTGDALSKVQKENNRLAAQNIAGANVYAAQQEGQIPTQMSNLAAVYQGLLSNNMQGMLEKISNMSKYASGQSSNESSNASKSWDWSSLLPYL